MTQRLAKKRIREAPSVEARVVVVGAGFAGGSFLQNLPSSLWGSENALLIDRAPEYTFVPLTHEVAVGRIHPSTVRDPIAPNHRVPYSFLQTDVTGVDLENNTLLTPAGIIKYRYLVLAPGSVAAPLPEGISDHFQTFWGLGDALKLRRSLNGAWQTALRGGSDTGGLTVTIVGGGATGVELAAEIAALFAYLRRRATGTPSEEPRVVLLEATDRLMDWLDPYFHNVALEELARLGVEVRMNTPVTRANAEGVEAGNEWVPAATRVWATGVQANPLVSSLPGKHDSSARVLVDGYLTLPDHPEVYVLGDSGVCEHPRLGPLPPTASVAVQQGPYVARDLGRRLRDTVIQRRRPFKFSDRGYVVSLGPNSAVAIAVGAKLRGRAAQALYKGIFLYYMKSSRGRLLASTDWAMERTLGRVGFDHRVTPGRTIP